jgi:hypothetical protein
MYEDDMEPYESKQAFDPSDPVGCLWDLAQEAIDNRLAKYPGASSERGLENTYKWLENNCDPLVVVHPYEWLQLITTKENKVWSPHSLTYEMGVQAALLAQAIL